MSSKLKNEIDLLETSPNGIISSTGVTSPNTGMSSSNTGMTSPNTGMTLSNTGMISNNGIITPNSQPSFIQNLPPEIWKQHICSFLNRKDLGLLRLVCKWFCEKIAIYPIWKQWCLIDSAEAYWKSSIQFSWNFHLYGVYSSLNTSKISDKLLQSLPPTVKELDLHNSYETLSHGFPETVPSFIEKIVFPFFEVNDILKEQHILSLLLNKTNLKIEFIQGVRFSVLGWASYCGYIETVRFLILQQDEKSLPSFLDQTHGFLGSTSLYIACQKNYESLVKLLLEKGANPNKPIVENRWTPLMIAAFYGRVSIIQLLLKYGASTSDSIVNSEGSTALKIAQQRNHNSFVVNLLKQKTS